MVDHSCWRERCAETNPKPAESPFRFMSAGKWLTPERYIVGWPGHGIVKVGTTDHGRRRWAKFLGTGAQIICRDFYDVPIHSLYAELWMHEVLGAEFPKAFQSKDSSRALLGDGGGWLECFSVPTSEWDLVVDVARMCD
jgi:hypothetical protein